MYTCLSCTQLQAAGVPSVLVPVLTRPVHYPFRAGAHPPLPTGKTVRARKKPEPRRDDPGGQGFETVREVRYCPVCAAKLSGRIP